MDNFKTLVTYMYTMSELEIVSGNTHIFSFYTAR